MGIEHGTTSREGEALEDARAKGDKHAPRGRYVKSLRHREFRAPVPSRAERAVSLCRRVASVRRDSLAQDISDGGRCCGAR
jgi:hypothetical protein